MSVADDGGPAFPSEQGYTPEGTLNETYCQGMTLRDWFAGLSMQGLCADPTNNEIFTGYDDAAQSAYEIADAMLAARKGGAA